MSELVRLIDRLKKGIAKNTSYIKTIKHPQLLISSLQELQDIIGNDEVKDAVATQIQHLIMVRRRAMQDSSIKEDEVMLNTVLYGPPGVGKTKIGTKLAKIWYSLGYLDGSKNTKEKKPEIAELLRDLIKDGSNTSGTDENTMAIYFMFLFILVFISIISMAWSFYNRFGGYWTLAIVGIVLLVILLVGYFVFTSLNSSSSSSSSNTINTNTTKTDTTKVDSKTKTTEQNQLVENPPDDKIIKVVTRADFVDQFVGWTAKKTNQLLKDNLGKVLFVDEAYSLINGIHDEFGMEALTTLNLFMSQRPKEIIVIFAGYKEMLESGVYSVQPGLKRRFMWHFNCKGYNADQLFEIFKSQLKHKSWGLSNEDAVRRIFRENYDAFPSFGGDTEKAAFFAELEHSRDYIANDGKLELNLLYPQHVAKGIAKLRDNNIQEDEGESSNPMANMMKLFRGGKEKKKPARPSVYEDSLHNEIRLSEEKKTVVSDQSISFQSSVEKTSVKDKDKIAYSDNSVIEGPEEDDILNIVRSTPFNHLQR